MSGLNSGQYVSTDPSASSRLTFSSVENLVAGTGIDLLDYTPYATGVTVNLGAHTATGIGSIVGFENITGSGFDDNLAGDQFDNIINGGAGSDTVNYSDSTAFVNVNLTTGVGTGTAAGSDTLVSIENATGSAFDDTLIGDGGANVLTGGAGNDWLEARGGNDTYVFGDNAGTDNVVESSGTDTLDFTPATVNLTFGLNAANVNVTGTGINTTHTGHAIENLVGGASNDQFNVNTAWTGNLRGGAGDDTFNFASGVNVNGSVDGGAGSDTLNYAAYGAPVNITLTAADGDGFDGTAANLTGGFANIDNLIGSASADTLTGFNTVAIWEIDGTNRYIVGANALNIAGFENYVGGSGADTFNISAAQTLNLNGGAGDDTFAFLPGAALTGRIDGGAGSDSLDYHNYGADVNVSLAAGSATAVNGGAPGNVSGVEQVIGSNLNNTLEGTNGDDVLIGGAGNNTLVGHGGNDRYVFDGNNWGTNTVVENAGEGNDTLDLSGATGALTFNVGAGTLNLNDTFGNSVAHTGGNVENLLGGNGGNVFNFANGATVGGNIVGGAGNDTLDFNGYATPRNVVLTALGSDDGFKGTASGIGGTFDNVNAITGSGVGGDTITGMNTASTWQVATQYTDNASSRALTFSQFETLIGGSGNDTFNIAGALTNDLRGGAGDDTFVLANGATLNGTIDGGAGTDLLDYALYNTAVNVNLALHTATNTAGVFGIENVQGGAGDDILTGDSGNNIVWGNAGNDILDGGAGDDVLYGGAGADTIDGSAGNDSIWGGTGDDTLTGGAGNDTFVVENNWGGDTISENIAGGTDTMDMSLVTTDLTIVLGSVTVTDGLGNSATHSGTNVENLIGGSANNTFVVNGAQTINLTGGAGDDEFNFDSAATLTGIVDGGTGNDTLNLSAYATAQNVTLTGLGASDGLDGLAPSITGSFRNINTLIGSSAANDTLTGMNATSDWQVNGAASSYATGGNTLGFSGFETLQGGAGNDTFTITGNQTNTLLGGAGDDTFAFSAGARLDGNFDGQSGYDTLDFHLYTTARTIALIAFGSVDGFVGTDNTTRTPTAFTGTFSNLNNAIGSSDPINPDVLIGMDRTSQWTLSGLNTYSTNPVLDISSFEGAAGGSGNDTFTISGAQDIALLGGAGDDTFIFGDGASITGSVGGDGGTDTLDFSQYTSNVTINLVTGVTTGALGGNGGFENMYGGSGNDSLTGNDKNNVISGGGGTNTLDGGPGWDTALNPGPGDTLISIEAVVYPPEPPPAPAPAPAPALAAPRDVSACARGRVVSGLGCVFDSLTPDAPTIFTANNYGITVQVVGDPTHPGCIAMFIVALPDSPPPPNVIFVGATISVWITEPDGSAITKTSAPIKLTFTIPDGLQVPAGGELMIAYFDPILGWRFIAATRVGNQLIASVNTPGTYVMVIVLP